MSAPAPPDDLLDLKLLPAWVNEPARPNDYADFEGEELAKAAPPGRSRAEAARQTAAPRARRSEEAGTAATATFRSRYATAPKSTAPACPCPRSRCDFFRTRHRSKTSSPRSNRARSPIRCFALARFFLEKPERYDVRLHAPEEAELFQLGENGPVATDRRFLEGSRLQWRKMISTRSSYPDRAD